jgi:hypothetical protein
MIIVVCGFVVCVFFCLNLFSLLMDVMLVHGLLLVV